MPTRVDGKSKWENINEEHRTGGPPFTFTYYWTNRKTGKIMAMGLFSFNNLERTHWTGIFVGISTQKASE